MAFAAQALSVIMFRSNQRECTSLPLPYYESKQQVGIDPQAITAHPWVACICIQDCLLYILPSYLPATWILCSDRILVRSHSSAALVSLPPDMRRTELDPHLQEHSCDLLGTSCGLVQCVCYVTQVSSFNRLCANSILGRCLPFVGPHVGHGMPFRRLADTCMRM